MLITPSTLLAIERISGYEQPFNGSENTLSLLKQVKLKLFTPERYIQLLQNEDVKKNRFIVENICKSILNHSLVKTSNLTKGLFYNWNEPRYDIPCSARIDFIINETIIDIHLTSCTTPSEFVLECYARKYYRHAAFVADGLNKANYVIVGVNKKKYNTFTVNALNWHAEGRQEYEDLIDKYICMPEEQRDLCNPTFN